MSWGLRLNAPSPSGLNIGLQKSSKGGEESGEGFVGFIYCTCAEGNGVHKGARDLLCCSLVPQREVISIKHTLFVLRCQEISEEGERMKRRRKGFHSSRLMKAVSND